MEGIFIYLEHRDLNQVIDTCLQHSVLHIPWLVGMDLQDLSQEDYILRFYVMKEKMELIYGF